MVERKRPEERREEILRAAGEVVLRAGFGRTSARELAAEVGVSAGLLHHYFPSLDDVLVRAVELFTDEDLEQLGRALGGPDVAPLLRLDRLLRFCEPVPDDPACRFWIESWAEALRNPRLQAPTRTLNAVWHHGLVGLVDEAVQDGSARCDDADAAARRLLALLDGLTVQVLVHGTIGPGELLTLVRRAAETELGLTPGTLAALGAEDHPPASAVGTGDEAPGDLAGGPEPHRRVHTARTASGAGRAGDG